jgi:hypothetical protein
MSDSLERLYQAVLAAKDLDPATSRTELCGILGDEVIRRRGLPAFG